MRQTRTRIRKIILSPFSEPLLRILLTERHIIDSPSIYQKSRQRHTALATLFFYGLIFGLSGLAIVFLPVSILSGELELEIDTEVLRRGGIGAGSEEGTIHLTLVEEAEGKVAADGIVGIELELEGAVAAGGL